MCKIGTCRTGGTITECRAVVACGTTCVGGTVTLAGAVATRWAIAKSGLVTKRTFAAAFVATPFFAAKASAAVVGVAIGWAAFVRGAVAAGRAAFISRLVAKTRFAAEGWLVAVGRAIAFGFTAVAGFATTETWLAAAETATRTEFLAAATAAVCVGGACRFLGLQAFDDFGRYGLADEVFNAAHFVAFGMRGQGVGQSAASGAAGTANTVDVVFGLHGQVVIDGVADALHVDTAGGHIGGNQNAQLAFLQHAQ